jgi:cobaltochelatase CobN
MKLLGKMGKKNTPKDGTDRNFLAQLILCKGCCCGQTEKGWPEVPIDWIKSIWKAEKLNRTVQLTVSGCIGPCDVPNVVMINDPYNGAKWYGNITGRKEYEDLVYWARSCASQQRLVDLPASIERLEVHPFRE